MTDDTLTVDMTFPDGSLTYRDQTEEPSNVVSLEIRRAPKAPELNILEHHECTCIPPGLSPGSPEDIIYRWSQWIINVSHEMEPPPGLTHEDGIRDVQEEREVLLKAIGFVPR